jgi:integrase/recombinase XerD
MKTPKLSPTILSIEEVNSMIDILHNFFWKVVIMTLYTTGMRQTELRNLKITDIGSKRMVVYIKNAKGTKDRQAVLSPELLHCLRTYWKICRTKSVKSGYLFIPNMDIG